MNRRIAHAACTGAIAIAVAEGAHRRRARDGKHRGRRPFGECLEVLAEPCLEWAEGTALEALDEAADGLEAFLERQPRVALAPLRCQRESDMTARHAQGATAAGAGGQAARRDQRVEHREAQGGEDRCGPEVGLDPLHDRREGHELAGGVEIEELVDEIGRPVDDREPVARPRPRCVDTGAIHGP